MNELYKVLYVCIFVTLKIPFDWHLSSFVHSPPVLWIPVWLIYSLCCMYYEWDVFYNYIGIWVFKTDVKYVNSCFVGDVEFILRFKLTVTEVMELTDFLFCLNFFWLNLGRWCEMGGIEGTFSVVWSVYVCLPMPCVGNSDIYTVLFKIRTLVCWDVPLGSQSKRQWYDLLGCKLLAVWGHFCGASLISLSILAHLKALILT